MFIHFPITFHRNEKRYAGKNVDLLFCCFHEPQKDVAGSVRSAEYSIVLHGTCIRVGYCDLRFGMNEILYYAGNIGYRIYFPYQGNHYAREAAGLLLNLAAEEYGMEQVLITCSPDNHASRKHTGCMKEERQSRISTCLKQNGKEGVRTQLCTEY